MSIPSCLVEDVSQKKGFTDVRFSIGNINGLIESKNTSSVKKDSILQFKKDIYDALQYI
jgi:hypothetical protein